MPGRLRRSWQQAIVVLASSGISLQIKEVWYQALYAKQINPPSSSKPNKSYGDSTFKQQERWKTSIHCYLRSCIIMYTSWLTSSLLSGRQFLLQLSLVLGLWVICSFTVTIINFAIAIIIILLDFSFLI